jgi:hypothetical protein
MPNDTQPRYTIAEIFGRSDLLRAVAKHAEAAQLQCAPGVEWRAWGAMASGAHEAENAVRWREMKSREQARKGGK